jgi:hypothetical protein
LPANISQCNPDGRTITCAGPPTPGTTCTGNGYSAELPLAECNAWQVLFNETNGTQWEGMNCDSLDPCGCAYCEGGHITQLVFVEVNLEGSIPSEIKDFTELTYLDLSGNALTGSIPAELADLTKLRLLNLNSNKLTGLVPALPWEQYNHNSKTSTNSKPKLKSTTRSHEITHYTHKPLTQPSITGCWPLTTNTNNTKSYTTYLWPQALTTTTTSTSILVPSRSWLRAPRQQYNPVSPEHHKPLRLPPACEHRSVQARPGDVHEAAPDPASAHTHTCHVQLQHDNWPVHTGSAWLTVAG